MADRFLISFVNTDEVFAVSSGQSGAVGKRYMYGLILTPYLGWSIGTLIGAVAGNILPEIVISALGIAIYGMFVAIVIPVAKKERSVALCVALAIALSCIFTYVPFINKISSGFAIIICTIVASTIFALVAPLPPENNMEEVSAND
jgi:predicted branched-subunit amino acid permease